MSRECLYCSSSIPLFFLYSSSSPGIFCRWITADPLKTSEGEFAPALPKPKRKRKTENRNPKTENRRKAEIRNPRAESSSAADFFGFRHSDFGFPSVFGFRFSDFVQSFCRRGWT